MLKRMREWQKCKKGVLTVEAAIILPVFILVMVFVLSIMKLCYFHLVMQQALQNVGLTLAQYGYVIERTIGMKELTLKPETSEKEQKIKTGVENVISEGQNMIGLLSSFELEKIDLILESGEQFATKAKDLVSTVKDVDGKTIVNYLLISTMNEVSDDFVKWMIGDYLTAMDAKNSLIENIEYSFHVESGSNDILLIVEYDYNFNFFFIDTIRLRQVVRMRPWIGGTTDGVYESWFKK